MFRKQYKVKTNTQMKGSEKKKLKSLITQSYPLLSADDLNSLIPNTANMTQAKITTHNGVISHVYYNGQNPCFYLVEEKLFPTIYTLWKFPNLLPVLSTWPPVFDKLAGGADLMLPGVVKVWGNEIDSQLKGMEKGDLCAIKLTGNATPVAVGTSFISGKDLISKEWKGKAVIVSHIYKDLLWQSGDKSQLPFVNETLVEDVAGDDASSNCEPVEESFVISEAPTNDSTKVELHSTETSYSLTSNPVKQCEFTEIAEDEDEEENVNIMENSPRHDMDKLLYNCFFTALKVKGKKIELPILTSTFYRSFVLACCPPEQKLDVKKTTFKKFSSFLEAMETEGIVKVKELSKGVESIIFVDYEHSTIKTFPLDSAMVQHLKLSTENIGKSESASDAVNYKLPEIKELYSVTASVLMLFKDAGVSKGSAISSTDVRSILKDYIKRNDLQNEQNRKEILMDPVLTNCLLNKHEDASVMTWEELHSRCLSKMQPAYEIKFTDETPVLKKGHLEPINITVAQRTGNKKVTIIHNLECYGINPVQFAHQVQLGVAASTSVGPTPNGKGIQALIQGNQVKYVGKLLLEQYKIPRKYLKGLENAANKKSNK